MNSQEYNAEDYQCSQVENKNESVNESHYRMDTVLLFLLKGSVYSKASNGREFLANYTQMEEGPN